MTEKPTFDLAKEVIPYALLGAVTTGLLVPTYTAVAIGAILGVVKLSVQFLKNQKMFEDAFSQKCFTLLEKELIFCGFFTFSPLENISKIYRLVILGIVLIREEIFSLIVDQSLVRRILNVYRAEQTKVKKAGSTMSVVSQIVQIAIDILKVDYVRWILYAISIPSCLGFSFSAFLSGVLLLFCFKMAKKVFGTFFIEHIQFKQAENKNRVKDAFIPFYNFFKTLLYTSLYFAFFLGTTYRVASFINIGSQTLRWLLVNVTCLSLIDLGFCFSIARNWLTYKIDNEQTIKALSQKLT